MGPTTQNQVQLLSAPGRRLQPIMHHPVSTKEDKVSSRYGMWSTRCGTASHKHETNLRQVDATDRVARPCFCAVVSRCSLCADAQIQGHPKPVLLFRLDKTLEAVNVHVSESDRDLKVKKTLQISPKHCLRRVTVCSVQVSQRRLTYQTEVPDDAIAEGLGTHRPVHTR